MKSRTFSTDRQAKTFKCPPDLRAAFIRDEEIKGLRLYATQSGVKSWGLYYRHEGRQRMITLGRYPALSLADARQKAREHQLALGDRDNPRDPLEERTRRDGATTVGELVEDYLARYARTKQRSVAETEKRFLRFILGGDVATKVSADPAGVDWSGRKAESIATREVADLHGRIGLGDGETDGRPYEANRVRRHLRSLFNKGKRWGLLPQNHRNPADDIEEFEEEPRDRWLNAEEMKRLIHALDAYTGWPQTASDRIVSTLREYGTPLRAGDLAERVEHPVAKVRQLLSHMHRNDPRVERVGRGLYQHTGADEPALPPKPEAHIARAAIWTILATGARKREVLGAAWDDVDLERGTLVLSGKRTKKKKSETKALPAAILELLKTLPTVSEYVFPDIKTGGALRDIRRPWRAIREKAGLQDVTLHDLRRTWASWRATDGEDVYVVSKVLGHSSVRVTEAVYAKVAVAPQRQAVERHMSAILDAAYPNRDTAKGLIGRSTEGADD